MANRFWMVYLDGAHTPAKVHPTKDEARVEAERLCRQEHRNAFVLEAIERCTPGESVWVELGTTNA